MRRPWPARAKLSPRGKARFDTMLDFFSRAARTWLPNPVLHARQVLHFSARMRSIQPFLTPSFQSDICSLIIRAACSALCCLPIASTKSPSGSTNRPQRSAYHPKKSAYPPKSQLTPPKTPHAEAPAPQAILFVCAASPHFGPHSLFQPRQGRIALTH